MKKFFLFLSVIFFLSSCNTPKNTTSNDAKGDHFAIKKGEIFEINLVTNASTGFHWEWTNKGDVTVVDSVGIRTVDNNPEGYVGGSVNRYWQFKGAKRGTDTLKFDYCRPWDKNEVARQRTVTVTVK